jgi:hypothetical protein
MSTTTNVAFALGVLLAVGSSAVAASNHHGKPVHRSHAQKQQQHAPATVLQSQNPGCVSDEGGGRIHPCGSTGGGGGGGGY